MVSGANGPAWDMRTVDSNGRDGRYPRARRQPRRETDRDHAAGPPGDLRHHGRDADLQRADPRALPRLMRAGVELLSATSTCATSRGHHQRGHAERAARNRHRGRVGLRAARHPPQRRASATPPASATPSASPTPSASRPTLPTPALRHPDADAHANPTPTTTPTPTPTATPSPTPKPAQAEDPAAMRSGQAVLEQRRPPGRDGQLQDLGVEHGGGKPRPRASPSAWGTRPTSRRRNSRCARRQRTTSAP